MVSTANAADRSVFKRMPTWRTLMWAGVVGSVVTWSWAWFVARGAVVVVLFMALATVVLALRGTKGMRVAVMGLIVAGVTMFLAALYWMYLLLIPAGQTSTLEVMSVSVFPMVAAMVLLLGAIPGYRQLRNSQRAAAGQVATS
jgi:hypothetical protein